MARVTLKAAEGGGHTDVDVDFLNRATDAALNVIVDVGPDVDEAGEADVIAHLTEGSREGAVGEGGRLGREGRVLVAATPHVVPP